eukprot:Em0010g659a
MSRSKRTLCLDEVLGLIDDDDDEPMTEGSEDEMDDLELDTDEMRVEADDDESITQTTTHTPVMSTKIDNFNEPVGPTFFVEQTPLSTFSRIFPDSVVEHIASQTNLYAKEALSPVQYSARQDTTADEIRAFFGHPGSRSLLSFLTILFLNSSARLRTSTLFSHRFSEPGIRNSLVMYTMEPMCCSR